MQNTIAFSFKSRTMTIHSSRDKAARKDTGYRKKKIIQRRINLVIWAWFLTAFDMTYIMKRVMYPQVFDYFPGTQPSRKMRFWGTLQRAPKRMLSVSLATLLHFSILLRCSSGLSPWTSSSQSSRSSKDWKRAVCITGASGMGTGS